MNIWAATGGSKLCSENKPPFWYLSMQVSGIRGLIHWAKTPFFCSKIASGGENLDIFLLYLFPYLTLWTTDEYPSLEAKNLAFVTENWQSMKQKWVHWHKPSSKHGPPSIPTTKECKTTSKWEIIDNLHIGNSFRLQMGSETPRSIKISVLRRFILGLRLHCCAFTAAPLLLLFHPDQSMHHWHLVLPCFSKICSLYR